MKIRRFRRVGLTAPIVLVLMLSLASPAAALVPPERVLGERGVTETFPFANDTYLAWSQNSRTRENWFNAYGETLAGDARRKINPRRTAGWPGNFEPGTDTLIFQQATRNSNLWLYDFETRDRSQIAGVNTRAWEWSPRISTGYVLFNRDFQRNGVWYTATWLYDRTTETLRKIEEIRDRNLYNPTGSVGETYATYTVCSRRTCKAFLYSIADRTTQRIPTVDGRPVYAAIVDEANGDLYFIRSGFGCGRNVSVWRVPVNDLSAAATKIADLGRGFDSYSGVLSTAPNASVVGSQDLYYDRVVCRNFAGDIFALRDVTSVPDATPLRAVTRRASTAHVDARTIIDPVEERQPLAA
jgi:hypothetical protein